MSEKKRLGRRTNRRKGENRIKKKKKWREKMGGVPQLTKLTDKLEER